MIGLEDIQQARGRIREAVKLTPLSRTEHFPESRCGQLYLKLENLQRTGSFKERGALNRLLTLTEEERKRGIIAASAGNHAQGVAYHAGRLGISATIAMPERTPLIKVSSTRGYGAKVVLTGQSFDDAYAEALRLQQEEARVFVHPFDDAFIMAGQGTIALELLEQEPNLDLVVIPIGGGGLISGMATALKALRPNLRIIGVQASAVAAMHASLRAGTLTEVRGVPTIAEGLAVKRPGRLTFEVIQHLVDDIVVVDEEEIASAILQLLEREKTVVEGAGAAGLAALIHGRIPEAEGKRVATVLCGGNIDVTLLSRIIERGLAKDGRLVRLVVRVPDRPGMLARLMTAIAEQGANVTEIYHNRIFHKSVLGEVEVEVTLETRGRPHVQELCAWLAGKGYSVEAET